MYTPPIDDMTFLLQHVTGFSDMPQAQDLDADTVRAVLEEAGKLAADILAPLNKPGDDFGAKLEDGVVTTAPGFKDAYAAYRDGGWNAVPFPEDHGGQGLPWALAFPLQEMWQAANMSFGLCPLLNQGAVEAILAHGSDEQKACYLPKLISGEWTGTMNLTEPQAGSDLAAVKSRAEPAQDGLYHVFGQKIYITYGEHDFADNIIHLVLARLLDAPEGVKGISLFIVPKYLEDGTRNDVMCTGIEHKLGIHASPTCTMQYGDKGGAVAELVGEPHQGLKYMFTMMNNARLSVGLQGVAISERALQHAQHFADERVQGKDLTSGEQTVISSHPDVRRMLNMMRALTEAGRAMAYDAAIMLDKAEAGDETARARVDLLTPIVKSWCTDRSIEVASLGVQVHGGMGFVEETGAAQYYRDARILPIYEGTNGIQAMDLLFRKILRDQGAALKLFIAQLTDTLSDVPQAKAVLEALVKTTDVLAQDTDSASQAHHACDLLDGLGYLFGAEMLQRQLAHVRHLPDKLAAQKTETIRFYHNHIMPRAAAHFQSILNSYA